MEDPEPGVTPPAIAIAIPAGEREWLMRVARQLPAALGLTYLILECHGSSAAGEDIDPAYMRAPLEEETLLPVKIAESGILLERDKLYVFPAVSGIRFEKGRVFYSSTAIGGKDERAPDRFLAAVAAGFPDCNAVLLTSNTASLVMLGLRSIQDKGGYTLLLSGSAPADPPEDLPPFVDLILPVEQVAARLKLFTKFLRPELRRHEEPADERLAVNTICRLVQQKKQPI